MQRIRAYRISPGPLPDDEALRVLVSQYPDSLEPFLSGGVPELEKYRLMQRTETTCLLQCCTVLHTMHSCKGKGIYTVSAQRRYGTHSQISKIWISEL